jgi:UDP-N-acetyl-D-galactosamine dehydrogenase
MNSEYKIAVIGLGYVGLPLAVALSKMFRVTGYDQDPSRIRQLRDGVDRTNELDAETLISASITYCDDPVELKSANIFIIAVPTPVDLSNKPDLGSLVGAAKLVGGIIRKGAIIVFESTVYPGVTEEICGPVLEEASGLACGKDFWLGYSPERINPGDRVHAVDKIVKIVAGQTREVVKHLAAVYGSMNGGKIFVAKDIKTAEAAKVIENAQRDINIAFMNEITQVFGRLGVSVYDVLDAANTKWNFLPFTPGLVGGHCIGIDPYYLAHAANLVGIDPTVLLSGRATNDTMAIYVADRISENLEPGSTALILGITFKENVPDIRNSKVGDVVSRLSANGFTVLVHDPLANATDVLREYGIELLDELPKNVDCVVGCVAHAPYYEFSFVDVLSKDGLIADLKGIWRNKEAVRDYRYWTL